MKILAVVPAFNEQRALPAVVAEIKQEATRLGVEIDVAVVDDGSSDDTAEAAWSSGARVIRLCRNLGIGG
ncbi:MAG TPA: glycosyltransferase, partial [Polyangia bacterium]